MNDSLNPDVLDTRAGVLARVAALLLRNDIEQARTVASSEYPFEPIPSRKGLTRELGLRSRSDVASTTLGRRNLTDRRRQLIWMRDGYRDRYSGARLLHPAALELFSVVLRGEFPFDSPPNGKYSATHICMWELWPAIDHVIPLAYNDSPLRDSDENLITTSALVNQLKSSYQLEDLGWRVNPLPPQRDDWDGLAVWVVTFLQQNPDALSDPISGTRLARWAKLIGDSAGVANPH